MDLSGNMEGRKVLIHYSFLLFSVLFFLFQTFRGIPFLPINPLFAFLLLIFWNTLKFVIFLKNYKLWFLYLAMSGIAFFIFLKCLKIFSATGSIFITGCTHFLIFSLLLFSTTTLLSLILIFSAFFRNEKYHGYLHTYVIINTIAFTYLDSFFIRAFKDELLFFATMLIVLSVIYKNIKTLKFESVFVFVMLFLSFNLLTDFLVIYKFEFLSERVNFISTLEYTFVELLIFIILLRYKYRKIA